MTVLVRPEAAGDITRAAVWYDEREANLGTAFVDEIHATLVRIEARPLGYPLTHGPLRRALTRRFPYAVFYVVDGADAITVIAVLHQRQDRKVLDTR
jgi:plasmid stabilization system protein ParE